MSSSKPRLLTGDTPTGRLHLGHWAGSVAARVALQREYECYFIIANIQAFTTRAEQAAPIRQNTLALALDYLAAGIDPSNSTIFIQSEVPALWELSCLLSMLVPAARVLRNPTLKEEIRTKGLQNQYSFGFLMYPVSQVADILAFRPSCVPVGEDQLPHLEMTREVARTFNRLYCGVDPQTPDESQPAVGGLFPIIQPHLSHVRRLVGIGPPDDRGQLLKMSKSLGNAIFLSDSPDIIQKKVMGMYTDPKRVHATDPGRVENNPLWMLHDAFNPDTSWILEAKARYQQGAIGDIACKKQLIEVLVALTEPMRHRRQQYENDLSAVLKVLRQGTARANQVAGETLAAVKAAMHQVY